MREVADQERELRQQAQPKRQQIEHAEKQLAGLSSQAGQQVSKLKDRSPDTHRAWEWIQRNGNLFENQVFGPPIVSCTIKDLRYVDQIESLFQSNQFIAITVQSRKDYLKLQEQLYGGDMNLADVQINVASQPLDVARRHHMPAVSKEQLQEYGLDGWALDFIDGPEPVLAMMCSDVRINSTGVTLQDVTEAQFTSLVESGIQKFVAGRYSYQTSRRREYGPSAVSTATRSVLKAKYWTNQPIDGREKRTLQENIDGWQEEMAALKEQVLPLREKMQALKDEKTNIGPELVCCEIIILQEYYLINLK
jgi:hypothetical protein